MTWPDDRFKRPPEQEDEVTDVSVSSVRAGTSIKATGVIEAKGPKKDDGSSDRGPLSIASLAPAGLLSSDIKVHAILEKILYEMKLIRLYAQEESGGLELGVTEEELKE